MLSHFSQSKDLPKGLQRLKLPFAVRPSPHILLETFKELEEEQYEHIEQSVEYEEVMQERIEELEKIVEDQAKEEGDDEEEFLSFFKGGVPHDKRAYFYECYENIFLDFQSAPADKNNLEIRNRKFLKAMILADMVSFLDNHEFFIFEVLITRTVSMFVNKYSSIVCRPNSENDLILKLPGKWFVKFFGLAAFVSQNADVCFKFFEVLYHKVTIEFMTIFVWKYGIGFEI